MEYKETASVEESNEAEQFGSLLPEECGYREARQYLKYWLQSIGHTKY